MQVGTISIGVSDIYSNNVHIAERSIDPDAAFGVANPNILHESSFVESTPHRIDIAGVTSTDDETLNRKV